MTDSQYIDDLKEHLQCSMVSLRQEALRLFVGELMVALAKQDYRLNDLLEALALYSEGRKDWAKVTALLDQAAQEVVEVKRHLTGKSGK